MKRIKRLLAFAIATMLLCSLFACGSIVSDVPKKLTLYVTFYPIYALTSMIAEDIQDVEVKCLVQPQDLCLRSYELSDWDMYMINYGADCIIAGGEGLESFETLLQLAAEERKIPLINVLSGTRFMSFSPDTTPDSESHFFGENPHLYMSAEGSKEILKNICDALTVIDPVHADAYVRNYHSAAEVMTEVCAKIKKQTDVCTTTKVAVFNESLLYAASEVKLDIVTCIERESGEGLYGEDLEACIKTILDNGAKIVLIEEQAPKSLVHDLEANGFVVAQLDIMNAHEESEGYSAYINALLGNAQSVANASKKVYSTE